MGKIKFAFVGLGNVASALIQGIKYYEKIDEDNLYTHGLMNPKIGEYTPYDLECVCAFDINKKKIGNDINDAIFEPPNCCSIFVNPKDIGRSGVTVKPGPISDGCAEHMKESFFCYNVNDLKPVDLVQELKDSGAEILLNLLPVGSFKASRIYTRAAIDAGCGFINGIPEFIVSEQVLGDENWVAKFEQKNLPCAGDDIKSQVGATILHRVAAKLFLDRGVIVKDTFQLNIGGNTDFENMKKEGRLTTKRKSKTSAVTSVLPYPVKCRIGPSDYVPFLGDKKICYLQINGTTFGGLPLVLDAKLRVEDSPNSAGVIFDLLRVMKIALDRKIGGALTSISSFSFKHPPIQAPSDIIAKQWTQEFIEGKRER